MKTRDRLIRQYVRERFGPEVAVPCYETLRTVWIEWFGPGGARQRYARSAAKLPVTGEHVVIHRPGQVVALDTSPLGVKVREHVFGEPVTASLTLALDLYTHSLVAFRLTLVSDTSVDVAMLLRDVMMPLPLRADWGQDMEWPYPGIPASLVASFAGHKVAGLPFFAPETVTTDHGSVYKNHHLIEVQRVIGANILPARVLRPTDKQAVERAFSGIQSLLLEMLPGWRGIDTADRGADPEADAVLTLAAGRAPGRDLDREGLAEPRARRVRPGVGSGHPAQPEHAVRRRDVPGRVRAADPRPGAVLRAAAGAPGEDPRPPRGEDPRAVV